MINNKHIRINGPEIIGLPKPQWLDDTQITDWVSHFYDSLSPEQNESINKFSSEQWSMIGELVEKVRLGHECSNCIDGKEGENCGEAQHGWLKTGFYISTNLYHTSNTKIYTMRFRLLSGK